MARRFFSNEIEVVIKLSKYCNLRCSYCYEFPHLGDKARISIPKMVKLFTHFSSFRPDHCGKEDLYTFIWHGGEPFMVGMDYYDQIGKIQNEAIGDLCRYHNSVQTNLTILTQAHIEALVERRFFKSIGISFDVYGDERHDVRGRPSTEKVLRNLQALFDYGIPTGAICVLSRSTLPHIKAIYKFYERLGLAFRILPFHIEAVSGQAEAHGLTPHEIAHGMCEAFDLWLSSEHPITLYPLDTYLRSALHFLNGVRPWFYDQESDETIFVVDTNGEVTGYETYSGGVSYGNIFSQSFEEIIYSPTRKRHADESAQRIERYCAKCPYLGACSGYPAASANALEISWFSENVCYVSLVIGHMVRRLVETGLGVSAVAKVENRQPSSHVIAQGHT